MKTLKKCLAMFLAILTLFSICSLSTTVFAAEYTEQKARTEYFDSALSGYLKNIVDTEDAVSISEKERVDQAVEEVKNSIASTSSIFSLRTASVQGTEETETAKEVTEELDIDHTRLTLELEDGENVAYLFSEPVSYLDEDGNIVYKDTDIISVTESSLLSDGYLYENADNNYKVYFGEDSSVGILLCSDKGSKISLIPNGANIVPGYVSSKKVDEIQTPVFEYDGVYGVNSLLRYTPQLNGCKEEIILSAYGGVSQFSFTLLTGDCIAAINSEGKIEIIDKNKNILDTIAEPYAYDAVGAIDETSEHYSECSYELTLVEDGVYTLTLVVPEEYLLSDSTVYPVTIDPTTSSIYQSRDIPVYSKYPTSTFSGNETNCFGKSNDYGYGRVYTYFAVPSDIKNYATINSAYIWMRETTGRTDTIRVRPYIVTSDWTNSTTWNTKASYGDYTCAFRLINSASEDGKGVYWYKFDIKSAVKAWTSGTKNRGLAFVSRTEIIDGTYVWRAFASRENSTSSYRPYVVINYTNDTTAPTVKSVTNPGKDVWKNTDIIVTATAEDAASGLATKGYLFDGGSTWQAPNSKKYSSEGTYTVSVKAKDKAGNISAAKSGGTVKIDKTAPQNVKVNNPADGVWKNTDVTVKITATDNLSGVASYSFDNGSNWQPSNSKTFSSNGTYTITAKAKDNATNVSSAVSGGTVKIDKTAPAVSKPTKYPDTEWSNTNVTVTNNATDSLSGIPTNGYSFNGGSSWEAKTKTYSAEGIYTVTPKAKDNAGNIGTGPSITVKIDKAAPTATVTGVINGDTVDVTVTASDALSGLHSTAYSFNGGGWVAGKTATLSATATHTILVRDKADNRTKIIYNPQVGTITISPPPGTWTKGPVTLTANGTNISQYNFDDGPWGTENTKPYDENTTAKVGFKDNSGNTTYINVPITNIDTTVPSINSVTAPKCEWTNQPITVTVTADDASSKVAQYSFDGGTTWQNESSITYTDDAPESVTVMVKDNAGNEASWGETISLPKYDNGIPTAPSVYEQDGTLYISAPSLGVKDGSPETLKYQIGDNNEDNYITVEGNSIELEVVRTYNVPVYAYVEDDAGNKAATTFTLENTLGEYTASYTDIALGEGLFPVEFGRTYTSTNGWFFTFDANVAEIDENSYVFTDFYGEKQYFIKNSKGQYFSVDEEELTIVESTDEETGNKIKNYRLNYGDMIVELGNNRKLSKITTDYTTTEYKWNTDGSLDITGGATVSFTDRKPTEITITRTDSEGEKQTKVVKYEWSDDGNLTKFIDAADVEYIYAYDENGLLTTNETETITYSEEGRVKKITQPDGAFVKYTYDISGNVEDMGNIVITNSKGVTEEYSYIDGCIDKDSSSKKTVYSPNAISNEITKDSVTEFANVITYSIGSGEDNIEEYPLYEQDEDENYIFYLYDDKNNFKETLFIEAESLTVTEETTYEQAKNVAEKRVLFEYDTYNNLSDFSIQDRVDGELKNTEKIEYLYNTAGDILTQTTYQWIAENWHSTYIESYVYNKYGNIEESSETTTVNTVVVINDELGERTIVKSESNVDETKYEYDVWNQHTGTIITNNTITKQITKTTYDKIGNIVSVDENGIVTSYAYDKNRNIIAETMSTEEGIDDDKTTTYIYKDGNLVKKENPDGTVAIYEYNDGYGNLTGHYFNGYYFTYNTLGSITSASAAVELDENGEITNPGTTIVSYTYSPDIKQDVEFSSFGNNQIIDYDYNADGEITAIKLDDYPKYEYKYSSVAQTETEGKDILTSNLEGKWVKINDKVSGLFKVIQENKTSVYDSNEAFVYSVETSSKDADNADSFDGTVTTIGGNVYTLVTEENEDTFKTNNNVDFSKKYVYNEDKDNFERTITSNVFYTDYGYGDNGVTVLENVFEKNDNGEITEGYVFNYGYENENISSETLTVKSKAENGTSVTVDEEVNYEYDNDQLVKADYGDVLYEYVYDYSDEENIEHECRGNITKKTITVGGVSQTIEYEYDAVWKDRLISYNGESIAYEKYDDNGKLIASDPSNPLIYRGNELTWTMGRQLATFGDISYTYNEDGIRTSKTSNGITTKFLLDGYNVIEQTDGTTTLHFFYDSSGEVIGFRYNGNNYFYVKNAMGDIIAITDSNKNIVAEYRYDPWGKALDEENLTEIGELNPFRYRSYYYDSDIEMYYLQSRYYDAEVGRFINCDDVNYIGASGTVASYNVFAYCDNEPICGCDPFGLYKIKTFSQQTWLTRLVGKLYGGNIGYKTIIFQMENDNAKLALDLVLEKVTNPNAAYRNSIVYAKDGVDIDFSIGGVDFDLVGGSASYTYTKKVELTSVGIVYKWAKDTVGFGTSFAQALPYNRERSTVSITLRLMLEVTHKYIKKSLLKIAIKGLIRLLQPVAQEACNVLYSLYKGTAKLNKLVPAMVKTLSKAY